MSRPYRKSTAVLLNLGLGLGLAIAVMAAGLQPAAAALVRDGNPDAQRSPRPVFARIMLAFEDADQQALADLVHVDGLRVTSGGANSRRTHYSPSQSFYYFKNMFRSHRTVSFEFQRMQEGATGPRAHALAVWHHLLPGSDRPEALRLQFILALQEDHWRIVEINTIR